LREATGTWQVKVAHHERRAPLPIYPAARPANQRARRRGACARCREGLTSQLDRLRDSDEVQLTAVLWANGFLEFAVASVLEFKGAAALAWDKVADASLVEEVLLQKAAR
jgi:hypothetical protein